MNAEIGGRKPIHRIGADPNKGIWKIDDPTGNELENAVHSAMVMELKPFLNSQVTICETPRTGDRGKDIIVRSYRQLQTLGQCFSLDGQDSILIHVECKSSSQNEPLQPEKVLGSIASDASSFSEFDATSKPDYFVLVTNSYLVPEAVWKLDDALKRLDVRFRLVDRRLLANYLDELGCQLGDVVLNFSPEKTLALEYQYRARFYEAMPGYELTIVCRNYADRPLAAHLSLQTDVGWQPPRSEELTLLPNGCSVTKVDVIRKVNDGIRDLQLSVKIGALSQRVTLEYGGVPEIIPKLCGRQDEIHRLKSWLRDSKAFSVFHLMGEAGVGKSRVLDELRREMDGAHYHFKWLNANRGKNANLWKSLRSFMRDKGFGWVGGADVSPVDMLRTSSHRACTLVVIIDDIHRGNEAFYEALRGIVDLQGSQAPVRVILCGRIEHDVFNCDYFSYLDWLSMREDDKKRTMELDPLTLTDTENLTKMLIEDLPDSVFRHIVNRSGNKPLFVIQFAEYLLDVRLATVRGHGTIGITDPTSLQRNNYLPRTVEEIYESRFKPFEKDPKASTYRDIVYSMAELDGVIDEDLYRSFFDKDNVAISDLIRRCIIEDNGKGGYRFVHETMLIFFQKKLANSPKAQRAVASKLLDCDSLGRARLDDLRLGKLNFWKGRKKDARAFLQPFLSQAGEYRNISHIDPNLDLYPYLFIIYDAFRESSTDEDALRRALEARVYIALHHFSPVRAIDDSREALSRLTRDDSQMNQVAVADIMTLKAHALLLTGQRKEGEGVINELLSRRLLDSKAVSQQALFDMYDRLCIINLEKNEAIAARNYNDLSLRIAEELEDDPMQAIGYRTRSKLLFHLELSKSMDCLDRVDDLIGGDHDRITTCNRIARLTSRFAQDRSCCDEVLQEAEKLLEHSISARYAWATGKAYLLIAACNLQLGKRGNLEKSRDAVYAGIDSAVHYGVASGLWQFYNLLGIIDTRLDYDVARIRSVFMTVRAILQRQGLFKGCATKPCFGNVLAISNLGAFLANEMNESEFCMQMHAALPGSLQVSNSPYEDEKGICIGPRDYEKLQREFSRAQEGRLLFTSDEMDSAWTDEGTGYYISLC